MRLDHLLSREKMLLGTAAYFPGSGEWKAGVECCLILRVPKGILEEEIWGCSSAGRAPALHAGGQEFDPPHLHQERVWNGDWLSEMRANSSAG